MSAPGLDAVLARPDVWRGVWRGRHATWAQCEPSGFARLDRALGGGWPVGIFIECMNKSDVGVEMALFLPVLKQLMEQGRVVLINPPYWPYAPALAQADMALSRLLVLRPDTDADCSWAAVHCLHSDTCRAVLLWRDRLHHRLLRQLQLAAEDSRALVVLLRPPAAARQHSPAILRLIVQATAKHELSVQVLKCRGRPPCEVLLPVVEGV